MNTQVFYGTTEILFRHEISPRIKSALITVDSREGVILKSPDIPTQQAQEIVKKKGAWILKKLELVRQQIATPITTGSRISYLGRNYYTKLI